MGKAKTQRTNQAARRYAVAKQVEQAIEQHNFDKLRARGVIVFEPTGNPEIYDYDPEYQFKRGGLRERRYPPKGQAVLKS